MTNPLNDFSPVLWDYVDWKMFLSHTLAHFKTNRIKPYSLAKVAEVLGFNSKSYLHNLLHKSDVFPSKEVRTNIAHWLKFDDFESQYFDLLVLLSKKKTLEEKNEIFKAMTQLCHKKDIQTRDTQKYRYFSHWYYPVIKELITLADWDGKYSTLAQWIKPNLTVKEVRAAVKDLEQMGIIERIDNHWVTTEKHIHSGVETQSISIFEYQNNLLDLAKVALAEQNLSERDISTTTFSINEEDLPELKLKLQNMQRELVRWLDSKQKNENRIMQLNWQLFSLTGTFKHGVNTTGPENNDEQ